VKSILLTKEVAQLLRVSEDYVRDLIRQKKIKAYKEGRRGGFRIPQDAVDHYIKVKQHLYEKRDDDSK
jgi:excisionase family DNA binding protein